MRSKRLTSPSRCPVKNYLFELPLHRKYSPDVSFRSANHPRPAQSRPPFAAHSPSRALRFPPCFGFLRPSLARSPSSAPMPYPKDLSPVLPHRLCALKKLYLVLLGAALVTHPSNQIHILCVPMSSMVSPVHFHATGISGPRLKQPAWTALLWWLIKFHPSAFPATCVYSPAFKPRHLQYRTFFHEFVFIRSHVLPFRLHVNIPRSFSLVQSRRISMQRMHMVPLFHELQV